jgi:hypothetical protein
MTTTANSKGIPAPSDVKEAVKRLVEKDGEGAAAKRLDMSKQTIARILGGLSVNRSTLGMVRARLGLSVAS